MTTNDDELEPLERALAEVSAKYAVACMTVSQLRARWYELHNQADALRRRRKRLPVMAAPIKIFTFELVGRSDERAA